MYACGSTAPIHDACKGARKTAVRKERVVKASQHGTPGDATDSGAMKEI